MAVYFREIVVFCKLFFTNTTGGFSSIFLFYLILKKSKNPPKSQVHEKYLDDTTEFSRKKIPYAG